MSIFGFRYSILKLWMRKKVFIASISSQKKREEWSSELEFYIASLGFIVGLANVWRFSYLCYENGGGAFIFAYAVFAALVGMPMYFIELAHGQFTKKGPIKAFDIVPIMKGVGACSVVMGCYSVVYYVFVITWGMLYLAQSFRTTELPWISCNNSWNTPDCIEFIDIVENRTLYNGSQLSVVEYWDKYVLRRTSGFGEIGTTSNWPLLLSFFATWTFCYFCVFKGTKSTGKVSYFTALFPYVILTVFVIRGCTLEGAGQGLVYYLKPDFRKLLKINVWMQAASQCLYSYGVGYTAVITFGSYATFNSNCYRYAMALTASGSLSSVYAGLSVFSVLGHLAHITNSDIETVVASGPGLAFQTYPLAISMMPVPQLWSVLFFMVIVLLGIEAQFCCVEGLVTTINDSFPNMFRFKYKREILPLLICVTFMLLGIPMTFGCGIYIFELLNNYAVVGFCLFSYIACECITIGYLYGIDKFFDDVKLMIGYYPHSYIKWTCKYLTPVVCVVLIIYNMISFSSLVIYGYKYTGWANTIGWITSISSVIMIPAWFIYELAHAKGNTLKEKWKNSIQPIYSDHLVKYDYTSPTIL